MDKAALIALDIAKNIQRELSEVCLPPEEGSSSPTQRVLAKSIVNRSRGYIEKVANQINGTYENGWYDASAVMIRRLLETLIIEAFEHYGISDKIKDPQTGDFYFLKDLIDKAITEPSWNLGRTARKALPKLKNIGDQSAHSRRYNAHRCDIDNNIANLREVVQELLYLANLK